MVQRSKSTFITLCGASLLFSCGVLTPAQGSEATAAPKPPLDGGVNPTGRGDQVPWFGGHGGSSTVLGAEYIYGFQGSTGLYVDSFAFKYWDGLGYKVTMPVGGSGGTVFSGPDAECPDGYWAVGVSATSSIYIHRLALICRNKLGMEQYTSWFGGPDGDEQQYTCPTGQHLAGFQVQSGIYLDGFQPFCKPDPTTGMPAF